MWRLVGGKRDGVRLGEPGSVVRVILIPGGGGWLVLGLASLVAPASSRQVKRRGYGKGRLEATSGRDFGMEPFPNTLGVS